MPARKRMVEGVYIYIAKIHAPISCSFTIKDDQII